jgi:hypothetical protein
LVIYPKTRRTTPTIEEMKRREGMNFQSMDLENSLRQRLRLVE